MASRQFLQFYLYAPVFLSDLNFPQAVVIAFCCVFAMAFAGDAAKDEKDLTPAAGTLLGYGTSAAGLYRGGLYGAGWPSAGAGLGLYGGHSGWYGGAGLYGASAGLGGAHIGGVYGGGLYGSGALRGWNNGIGYGSSHGIGYGY